MPLHSTFIIVVTMIVTFILPFFALVSSQPADGPEARLIVNGSLADIRDYPYVARINPLAYPYGTTNFGFGGATIISNRWILTAAHNLDGYPDDDVPVVGVKIRVGISSLNETGQVVDAELRRCHPLYELKLINVNDICLLKTADVLEFNEKVQPADLPTLDDMSFTLVNVTGFGDTEKDSSVELRTTKMKIGSTDKCKEVDSTYNEISDVCFFNHYESSNPSFGDSGSGFVARRKDGSPVVLSLLSASNGNCHIGPFVLLYTVWIKRVMEEHT